MIKFIHYTDTLNIYYNISKENIENIATLESKDITELDNLQNVKKIQWSPNSADIDEKYTFKIGNIERNINIFGETISIYSEGENEDFWIEGHSANSGSQSKEDTHLFVRASDTSGGAHRSWVTSEPIDITDFSELKVTWEGAFDSNSFSNSNGFALTKNETDSRSEWKQIVDISDRSSSFSKQEETFDLDETGEWHIVFLARDGDSANSRNCRLKLYEFELLE